MSNIKKAIMTALSVVLVLTGCSHPQTNAKINIRNKEKQRKENEISYWEHINEGQFKVSKITTLNSFAKIAVDKHGNIYLAQNKLLKILNKLGHTKRIIPLHGMQANDISVDQQGDTIYLFDGARVTISILNTEGKILDKIRDKLIYDWSYGLGSELGPDANRYWLEQPGIVPAEKNKLLLGLYLTYDQEKRKVSYSEWDTFFGYDGYYYAYSDHIMTKWRPFSIKREKTVCDFKVLGNIIGIDKDGFFHQIHLNEDSDLKQHPSQYIWIYNPFNNKNTGAVVPYGAVYITADGAIFVIPINTKNYKPSNFPIYRFDRTTKFKVENFNPGPYPD